MPLSVEQFAKALADSGLMTVDDLKAFHGALPPENRPKSSEALVKLLVESGKLTPYQAQELSAGRGERLVLGDYVLQDKLGAGGMGQVFKALHRRMGRMVALKVMAREAMHDEASVRRFQREVRAAARLDHPNIVAAYDAGQAGDTHFLVMQLAEGSDLGTLVRREGPLSVERAVEYVSQAAQGLAFAHHEGVVHRDIKPANLLLDKKGRVRVLDMGLARFDDASSDGLTGTEQVMGTVDYMSPEQAADTKHVDARTDVYSLGCTLWYLLTGKRLYDADTAIKRILKHREAPLPLLVKERDDVSWPLEQVFHKLIAKQPADRYQSMDDVVAALEPHRPAASTMVGATSLNVSQSSLERNPELASFLQSVADMNRTQPTLRPAAEKAQYTTIAAAADHGDRTTAFVAPESETDPPAEKPVGGAAPSGSRSTASRAPAAAARMPGRLIAAGIATAALVVTAIVFVLTARRDGDPQAAATTDSPATGAAQPPGRRPVRPFPTVAPFDAAQARAHQDAWAAYLGLPREWTNSLGMTFVLIPPGEFLMGSTEEELARVRAEAADMPGLSNIANEAPQHLVRITRPFYCSTTETTIRQFRAFADAAKFGTTADTAATRSGKVATDPAWRRSGKDVSDDCAVEQLSWNDAVAFCNWLATQSDQTPVYIRTSLGDWAPVGVVGYRLPTEAEWEYACRAGTTTPAYWANPADAPKYLAGQKPSPALERAANPFGLKDMLGNVFEYCQDAYQADYYAASLPNDPPGGAGNEVVLRGGTRDSKIGYLRSAFRGHQPRTSFAYHYGFRVVLPIGDDFKLPPQGAPPKASSGAVAAAAATAPAPVAPQVPPGDYALDAKPGNHVEIGGWNFTTDHPLTIEAWITPLKSAYQSFLGNGKQAGLFIGFNAQSHWQFVLNYDPGAITAASEKPAELGRRTHVAAVYDTATMWLYIDGKLQGEPANLNRDYLPSNQPFWVGAAPGNTGTTQGKPHSGGTSIIDELRISRTLRYKAAFKPAQRFEPDADTIVLYHFDEGAGDVVRDASAHHFDAKRPDGAPIKFLRAEQTKP